MSYGDHLEALRPHLVRSLLLFALLLIAAFALRTLIIDKILFGPTLADFPTNRLLSYLSQRMGIEAPLVCQEGLSFINTSLAGQLNLHLKISMMTALVVGFPYLAWELWRFIKPALKESELRACRWFTLVVSLGFFSGILFGYFVISPLTVNFLGSYSASSSIVNMIDAGSYLSTIVEVSLACAIIFQLPLLVYFLSRMGVVSSNFMQRYRRHAIVTLAAISAIITPPDIFSMILVILPLMLLYEGSIGIARRVERHTKVTSEE